MCQVGEDYGAPGPAELQPKLPWRGCGQRCMKCKEGLPVLIIRAGDAFCRDCFKAYYIHKFRAMLGKNRLIFPGEKVLLAWSGGPSSSSMIWQVQEGLSRESAKRLRFVPGIVYIDEGAVCGQSPEERAKTVAEMKLILQTVGFPYHIVSLEEVFHLPTSVLQPISQDPRRSENTYKEAVDGFIQQQQQQQQQRLPEEGDKEALLSDEQIQEKLRQLSTQDSVDQEEVAGDSLPRAAETSALMTLFNSVKTLTAKEELLQTLQTHLILHVARVQGYSKVMLGDSCTRLAIKLMTNLALGRGAFLAWDTGFSDDRHGDVVMLRPMRDYTLKEIAFYNRMFAVPSVFTPAIDTKAPEKASIHRLMESFILRLQAQFPSTISTVYRTSEKLVKAPRGGDTAGAVTARCLLCMCALDIDSIDSATAFGAQTSEYLSQKPSPAPTLPTGAPGRPCCAGGTKRQPGCCQDTRPLSKREEPRASFIEQLCYSCRVNMKDVPSLEPLPPYILTESQCRSQRAWEKQEIQEFLFEESEEEDKDET
ncbi:cytoplasmic tRNA 2-thiolation protein 2 [Trichosurus vulpecula]|uniref:cytoplasmic tRNA 2-thiolation protein 2 n=1 Tax=Trichosurus vulpecula TaxID=9337 RepID=UPI00186B4F99|nr:cytoplasmic tRNA 2-thiolation protein 2 [Trichosurus vulpecula]